MLQRRGHLEDPDFRRSGVLIQAAAVGSTMIDA